MKKKGLDLWLGFNNLHGEDRFHHIFQSKPYARLLHSDELNIASFHQAWHSSSKLGTQPKSKGFQKFFVSVNQ
jgi:hypothetical protein